MSKTPQSHLIWRLKSWQTILLFGILLCAIVALGTFFFDFFAGSATMGFGVMGEVRGTGMFFVYMIGYFNALVVILPILLIRRFGVGTAVYLPYAVVGFFVEYYYEWIKEPVLVSPWAVVGWCIFGLATGFSVDLAYHFFPFRLSERLRAIIMGIVLGCVNFLLTLVALTFFYISNQNGPGSFLGLAYFCLPWLIVDSGFGGYTAYAISRNL